MRLAILLIFIALFLQISFAQDEPVPSEKYQTEKYIAAFNRIFDSCSRNDCGSDEVCYNNHMSQQTCLRERCFQLRKPRQCYKMCQYSEIPRNLMFCIRDKLQDI